jgi:Flp pilus assembly protein TadD
MSVRVYDRGVGGGRTTFRRTEVDGVDCFWQDDGADDLLVALLFRIGFADESFRTSGISHLAEHLALPTAPLAGVDYNGTVDCLTTLLWARGDPRGACELISEAASSLSDPPLARFEREREILRAEALTRSWNQWRESLSLRFGPVAHGLVAYREVAPDAATDEEIAAWMRTRFTKANAVLYLTGKPPPNLKLALRAGRRRGIPAPRPIDYISYPAAFSGSTDGTIAVSIVYRRSYAIATALQIANARLHQQLRHRAGTSYAVDHRIEFLGRNQAHALIWADCVPSEVVEGRNTMLGVLEELAQTGPTDAELAFTVHAARRWASDPAETSSNLHTAAHHHLLGREPHSQWDAVAALERLTPAEVANALRAALRSTLLLLPDDTPIPGGRFTAYPLEPRRMPRGRSFSPTPDGDVEEDQRLIVGTDGVAIDGPEWKQAMVYADCVGIRRWDDGTRELWSSDGFRLVMDPADWQDGAAATRAIDRHSPREQWIDFVPTRSALGPDIDAAVRARDWDLQIELLRAELERDPRNASAWAYLARALRVHGSWAQALVAAEKACELDPLDSWAQKLRARTLLALERRAEAADAVRAAVRADPGDADILSDAAWILSEADEENEAMHYAERSLELHPDAADSWFARGRVFEELGKLDRAERDYRRTVELEPETAAWWSNLGGVLIKIDRVDDAREALERAVALDPKSSRARSSLALAVGLQGDLERSRALRRAREEDRAADLANVLAADPDNERTRRKLALSLYRLGRRDDALALARTLDTHGQSTHAWIALAAGHADEAAEALERLRRIRRRPWWTYLDEANLASLLGDARAAAAAARAVEEHAPYLEHDQLAQGYEAAAANRWRRARQRFGQALKTSPRDCCAQTWRGLVDVNLGEGEAALAAYLRAEALSTCECAARLRLRNGVESP